MRTGKVEKQAIETLRKYGKPATTKQLAAKCALTSHQITCALGRAFDNGYPGLTVDRTNRELVYQLLPTEVPQNGAQRPQGACACEQTTLLPPVPTNTLYAVTGATYEGYPCLEREDGTNGLVLLTHQELDQLKRCKQFVDSVLGVVVSSQVL